MTAPLSGVHVAVAGDDTEALEFLTQALEYCGALVTAHASARSVIRLMQLLRVNVLVVDVGGADEASLALIRKVRALPREEGGRVPGMLVFHENRDFCDACLAASVGATPADVQAAIEALRRRSTVIMRDRWVCQLCRKKGPVTRALPNRTVATKTTLRRRAVRSA